MTTPGRLAKKGRGAQGGTTAPVPNTATTTTTGTAALPGLATGANGKLDPVADWEKFSKVAGVFGKKARSEDLKKIDKALAKWLSSGRTMQGDIDRNLTELTAVLDAIRDWEAAKKEKGSEREPAVKALVAALIPIFEGIVARGTKKKNDEAIAKPLFDNFQKMDAETSKFAGKNLTDVSQDRFVPDKQTSGLMAHTKKNADGTLTDEAMDALDDDQIAEAKKLRDTARTLGVVLEGSTADAKATMDGKKNPLTNRTELPELKNLTDPSTEAAGEVTEKMFGVSVIYDKSDVHAGERLGSLKSAVDLVTKAGLTVPPSLEVYFPKFGREVKVSNDCKATIGKKVADAVFHPPNFLAVSSANTGNAKTDKMPNGDLKFLSAALGADEALTQTIVHEMGHALHYHNDRSRFYNLNFAFFKGKTSAGKTYQSIAESEVSGYGNNPREMVAEVFVAAVTGKKTFSDVVWEMYDAFGGVPLKH